MHRTRLWPQLAVLAVLAIGAGLLWGLPAAFFTSMWESYVVRGYTLYENLQVTPDGDVLIGGYTYVNGTYQPQPFRTLDGKTFEQEQNDWLRPASLYQRSDRRKWHDGPMLWQNRLISISDHQRLPATWYVIRDDSDAGRAYLAGYDETSRSLVGYIGREGFRGNEPPIDEHFLLGPGDLYPYGGGRLAGAYVNNVYSADIDAADSGVKLWRLYMVDEDHVVEVDTRARTVRTILTSPKLISIAILTRPSEFADAADKKRRSREATGVLGVRLDDAVAIIDPSTDQRLDFQLPEPLRSAKGVDVYQVKADQALVDVSGPGPTGTTHVLSWIDSAGQVAEQKTLELSGWRQPSDRQGAVIASIVAPAPLVTGVLTLGILPGQYLAQGRAANYSEAVNHAVRVVWPAALVVAIVALGCAWLVARWQRQCDRPHTAAWCVAVFLMGIPGLIAYLLHHGRTYTMACRHCGQIVPRRREACARCGESFGAPALTGVEVFA